jgi:hypothetical protein
LRDDCLTDGDALWSGRDQLQAVTESPAHIDLIIRDMHDLHRDRPHDVVCVNDQQDPLAPHPFAQGGRRDPKTGFRARLVQDQSGGLAEGGVCQRFDGKQRRARPRDRIDLWTMV